MSESYGALATDVFVNQRLQLKMDMPAEREAVLPLFDRVRRDFKHMTRFRRLDAELALESDGPDEQGGLPHQWVSLRRTSLRSGVANPEGPKEAYKLHKLLLDVAPNYLSINTLDIEFVELLFGFDLSATGNHDAIVFDALLGASGGGGGGTAARAAPLASLLDVRGSTPLEFQPTLCVALNESLDLQAQFEVKTRTTARAVKSGEYEAAPISVYLTLRQYATLGDVKELKEVFATLSTRGEELLESHVIPKMLLPIREAIASSGSA